MKENIKIRIAEEKDIPNIVPLAIELMRYHEKIDPFYKICSNAELIWQNYINELLLDLNSRVTIAESDDEIIGYSISRIVFRPHIYEENKIGDISDCFIKQEYRGKFILQKLIKDGVTWFQSKGIRYIGGQVDIRNIRTSKLWQAMGYQPYIQRLVRDFNE